MLPTNKGRSRFTKWAKEYGPLVSLKLGSSTTIVISDRSMVKALIDKKSAIYSDRPPSYIANDLITKGDSLLVMNLGERWRLLRKLMYQKFHESRCEREYITLQNAEAVQMLKDYLVEPEGLMRQPKRFSNSIIMSLGKFHLRRLWGKNYPAR